MLFRSLTSIPTEFTLEFFSVKAVGKEKKTIKIFPIRKTPSGTFEKLIEFSLYSKQGTKKTYNNSNYSSNFISNSVLENGRWLKIGVTQSGIYKLDKSFFQSMGLQPDLINPKNIRIYGNGGRMLPESNSVYRPDDLVENAIFVQGESDNFFDDGDYVLFYGQSPNQWKIGRAHV